MKRLLVCLALLGLAGPAAACINDAELPAHEREFRSQYNDPAPPPDVTNDSPQRNHHWLIFSAGGVLLIGGIAVALTNRRPGK